MPLSAFHPVVERWFQSRFAGPTEPQAQGWPAIAAGRHPFHLAGAAPSPASSAMSSQRIDTHRVDTHRIDRGVVTEAVIGKLPKGTQRLVLAAGVSITPLARDKAKARNISIERIGP